MDDKKKKNDYIIVEEPPKRKGKPKPKPRANGRRWLVVGLLLGLVLVGAGMFLVTTRRVGRVPDALPMPVASSTLPPLPTHAPLATYTPSPTPFPTRLPFPTPRSQSAPKPTTIAEHIDGLAWSPDGRTLAVLGRNSLRLYNADYLMVPPRSIQGYDGAAAGIAYSPDGKTLAISSHAYADGGYQPGDPLKIADITLWDTEKETVRAVLKGHTNYIGAMRFSPDGKRLASGSMDKTVRVWDVMDGTSLYTLPSEISNVEDVAFGPLGLLYAEGTTPVDSPDGAKHIVQQWPLGLGKIEPHTPMDYGTTVFQARFTDDGEQLAWVMGGTEGIWMVDIIPPTPQRKIHPVQTEGTSLVSVVAISPDKQLVAAAVNLYESGSTDSRCLIEVGSSAGGDMGLLLTTSMVNVLAFSPDSRQLAIGTDGGRVQLVDVQTGALLQDLQA
jgi:WD40 repeat protein